MLRLNAVRVLIVEDDLNFAAQVSQALGTAGYYVQNAYNVGDARFAVDNGRFDVVLVDTAMHDRDGHPISDVIDAHPAFSRLPLVTLTPRPASTTDLLRHVAQAARIRSKQTDTISVVNAPETDDSPTKPRVDVLDLDERLRQQLAELQTLSALGRSLSSTLELSDVLNQIVEAATALTRAEEGLLLLPDDAGAALYVRAMKGLDSENARNFRIRTDDTLAGRVYITGQPILVGARGWQKVKTEYFVKSLLYVPLNYKGQVIGVLGVNNKRADRIFSAHDQELLLDLAAHAAIALANAKLYENQVAQTRQLTTLVEAGRAVNSTLALDGVLSQLCQQIVRALDMSGCLISELPPDGGELRALAMARRALWSPDSGTPLSLDERPTLKSALEQNAYYDVTRAREGTRWLSERYYLERSGATQTVVLPLLPGGQPLGVLELCYLRLSPELSAEQRRAARALAVEIAAASAQRLTEAATRAAFGSAQNILTQTGADWCVLWLVNARQNATGLVRVLEYGEAVWLDDLRPAGLVYPAALSAFNGAPMLSFGSRDHELPDSAQAVFSAYGAEAVLCLPLTVKGAPLGALTLYDVRDVRRFTPGEIGLAQAMLAQAASALENARLFHDLDNSLNELRQAQIRLVQAARLSAMGELAAAVAHQINNPLTTVLAESEMLIQDMPADDPDREAVSAIHRAGKRAHTVVRRLLSTARRGSAEDAPSLITVDESIQSTLELVASHIQRGRVTLNIDLGVGGGRVQAIPGQLEDVWLNLLMNAHDAVQGTPGASVAIQSRRAGDQAVVRVSDTGRGIAAADQVHIFDPFFTTKPVGEGTGLGLYICKQVIDSARGSITLESAPGKGTAFTVTLPLSPNAAPTT